MASAYARSPILFSPTCMGNYVLANRVVMAPMTRGRVGPGHVPHPLAAEYYSQRATAGFIITEAAHVAASGAGYIPSPGIYTLEQVRAWQAVTDAIHAKGGRIFLQLWHAGRLSSGSVQHHGELPVAPSAIAPEGELRTGAGRAPYVIPRALAREEITALVKQFARSAQLALTAGFDGVDLHAANGYLIDQFLRSGSNLREDEYGGSVAKRARFLLEVAEAVVGVWGPQRVGVRLSPLNPTRGMRDNDPLATSAYIASALGKLNVGYLHMAEPGPGHPRASPSGTELLKAVRRCFSGCLVVDGGCDRASAEAALLSVGADLVALATPFIANPDLVERFGKGFPLAKADPATFYRGQARGYVDYPPYVYNLPAASHQLHRVPRL
jgi:N-ethylmaleimide reductase